MSRTMNTDNQDNNKAGPGHNSVKIDERISGEVPKIFALEQKLKALTLEHIAPVRKELSKIWTNLKGDTGFSIKYMKSIYNIHKLVEEANLFDDDQETKDALEAIRMSFDALEKGGHLDLLRDIAGIDKDDEGDSQSPDDASSKAA